MTEVNEYAKALFLLTEEDGTTEEVREDVKLVRSAIIDNPEYTKLLDTPALPADEKVALLDRAFSSVNASLLNLCKILSERRYSYLITRILDAYLAIYDQSRGIERVEAITAVPLTEAQLSALSARLEAKTGKTIIIANTVDRSVLGGMKLRYMGMQIDGTVKARLDSFEKSLKSLII